MKWSFKSTYCLWKCRKLARMLHVIGTHRTPNLNFSKYSENRYDQMTADYTEDKSDDDDTKRQSEALLYVIVIPSLTFSILCHYDSPGTVEFISLS